MIDVRDKPRHKNEVEQAASNGLISDMDIAASGISSLGKHCGSHCFGLAGMETSQSNIALVRGIDFLAVTSWFPDAVGIEHPCPLPDPEWTFFDLYQPRRAARQWHEPDQPDPSNDVRCAG